MLEVDFPETMPDFMEEFGTDAKCADYLFRQRWPDGFRCPRCGSGRAWRLHHRLIWECGVCGHQTSLTAGTVFEGTRKPLRYWFLAMYLVTTSKRGISAVELQRQLNVNYQTAWAWLHKLRSAMVRPDRERLMGHVEVDETYIGGRDTGQHGRGAIAHKSIVACAAEREVRRIGRIRLSPVQDASAPELRQFITVNVEEGSVAITDGWASYRSLADIGYEHQATALNGSGLQAHTVLPATHRVFSLVKRWILGTYHGSVSAKHLPWYLQEFVFRFNRRFARTVTHRFQRLFEGAVRQKCRIYREIVHGVPT